MIAHVPVQRFWLFGGSDWYPSGGIRDLRGQFDSVADALAALPSVPHKGDYGGGWGCQWADVVDVAMLAVVVRCHATYCEDSTWVLEELEEAT